MPSMHKVFKSMCPSVWPKLLTGVYTLNFVALFNIDPNQSNNKLVLYERQIMEHFYLLITNGSV